MSLNTAGRGASANVTAAWGNSGRSRTALATARDGYVSNEIQIEYRETGAQPLSGLLLVPAAIALAEHNRRLRR